MEGSGVSLYSSSVLAHMTFMALESNIVKKQERQAKEAFRNEMNALDKRQKNEKERKQNELLYSYLYPAYQKAVIMFFDYMLNAYLEILQSHSRYEYSKLKLIDLEKSNGLLDNLSVINDKKRVLMYAFVNCPYNIRVYEEVVNFGYMDYNTFETARIFGKDVDIIECIKDYCIEHIEEKDIVTKYVGIISAYENVDCNTALNQLYQEEIIKIKEEYRNIRILLGDLPLLKRKIKTKLSLTQNNLCILSEKEIKRGVDDVINQIHPEKVNALLDYGIISHSEFGIHDDALNSLDKINLRYKELLLEKTIQCIRVIKEEKKEEERKKEEEKEREREIELEELKRKNNEYCMGSVITTILSILLTVVLFVPVVNYVIKLSLLIQSILFWVSILSVKGKISDKKIGIIFGWIGCVVSGLNIVAYVIELISV